LVVDEGNGLVSLIASLVLHMGVDSGGRGAFGLVGLGLLGGLDLELDVVGLGRLGHDLVLARDHC
jgi:hypothetical protein